MQILKRKVICAVLIVSAFFGGGVLRKNVDAKTAECNEIEAGAQTAYIVREVNGNIGIYRKDEAYPVRTLDIMVDSLPETEQRMLDDGIVVENEDELIGLIEDYTS